MLSFCFLISFFLYHNHPFRAKVSFSFAIQCSENEISGYCSQNRRMRKNECFFILVFTHSSGFSYFLMSEQRAQLFCSALLRSIGSLFVETSYFKPVSAFYVSVTEKSMMLLKGLVQIRISSIELASLRCTLCIVVLYV